MNKLAINTAFLGGGRNHPVLYPFSHPLEERLAMAALVTGCDGVELCYPARTSILSFRRQARPGGQASSSWCWL
jgi:hypothetical protein